MSEKLNISSSYYSKFEYGTREPGIETLLKIKESLGETLDFILGADNLDSEGHKLFSECANSLYEIHRLTVEKDFIDKEDDSRIEVREQLRKKRIFIHEELSYHRAKLGERISEFKEYTLSIPGITCEFVDEYVEHLQKESKRDVI